MPRLFHFIYIILLCMFISSNAGQSQDNFFPNLNGPDDITEPVEQVPTSFELFTGGADSRACLLLTDVNSTWIGLVHAFKTIGIPFKITTSVEAAVQHDVVFVYPIISGSILNQADLQLLADIPRNGGTLVGFQVLGGLRSNFGFEIATPSRKYTRLNWNTVTPYTSQFTDPAEIITRIGDTSPGGRTLGVHRYESPDEPPLATYEDGSAAITQNPFGEEGMAIAVGIDFGFFIRMAFNDRAQTFTRNYINNFEPSVDVILRFLEAIYQQGEPDAITLGTVPYGEDLTTLITHDVDFTDSVFNSLEYADYERSQNIPATYFIQTKYLTDFFDTAFYTPENVPIIQQLKDQGMEIASHSVSHSPLFASLDEGTGNERYPDYEPFVIDFDDTANATVLGELRVSKYMLDTQITKQDTVSFRPGFLANPFTLPQNLLATGYQYSSTVAAGGVLSHLPFQLTYNRDYNQSLPVFEFPVTFEDEREIFKDDEPSSMSSKAPFALELARKIARYGGVFNVLIHPNVTADKLEFLELVVPELKTFSWFGTVEEFGGWWAARNEVEWDVEAQGQERIVTLNIAEPIAGLNFFVPDNYEILNTVPSNLAVLQSGNQVVIDDEIDGDVVFKFEYNPDSTGVENYLLY